MKTTFFLTIVFFTFNFSLNSQNTLIWSTYYGGSLYDIVNCVATDLQGNVYIAGNTNSTSNIASGGFQNTYGGGTYDAFLAKFDQNGTRLWATYFGSNNNDFVNSIAVDNLGNVYLAGGTSSNFGISSGGFQNTYGGGSYDALLVKFNPNGNLIWSTYYGGSGWEEAYAVTTDNAGNVYLGGFTNSTSNISFSGFQNSYGGGTYDAFLVKFNSNGTRSWATYYGGSGSEGYDGYSLATDANNNVFFSGWTASTNNIASVGFQNSLGGANDAFLVKFNTQGTRLWATYYGGLGNEGGISNILFGKNLAVDINNNVYLSGTTESTSNISFNGFQNTHGGGIYDCYFVKFDSLGTRIWASYYGGSGDERIGNIALDENSNIFLIGRTNSNQNISSGGFQNTIAGSFDSFLATFDTNGNRLCATYFGGSNAEWAYAGAVFQNFVYLPGFTFSLSGIASNGFQNTYAGGTYDGFLAKFSTCILTETQEFSNQKLKFYPNPLINISLLQTNFHLKNATLTLFNSKGQLVEQIHNIEGNSIQINTKNLTKGIYFVQLMQDNKVVLTDKLLYID